MSIQLAGLGLDIPVIAAPMAGGASTPALVVAAAPVARDGSCSACSACSVTAGPPG